MPSTRENGAAVQTEYHHQNTINSQNEYASTTVERESDIPVASVAVRRTSSVQEDATISVMSLNSSFLVNPKNREKMQMVTHRMVVGTNKLQRNVVRMLLIILLWGLTGIKNQ